jgi:NADPH:quinone reductase-like Zn-dependent oxidoreductase
MSRTMRAVRRHEYGQPEAVLRLETTRVPEPGPDQLRVRVAFASVNPADRYSVLGTPHLVRLTTGLRRPRDPGIGTDVAGVVDAVGADVTGFAVGDRVVGASPNGYAELATVRADRAALLPEHVRLEDAATLPIAGATALQGLRRAGVGEGTTVLVNGASGGVGHLAVQLAKAAGAEVTGVCSTRNLDLVRSLGADDVIDHTTSDYTSLGRTWDVLFDNQGNHDPRANRGVLADDGVWIAVGGPMTSRWVGPLRHLARAALVMLRSPQRFVQFVAREDAEDLATLVAHVADGSVRPHVERVLPLEELAAAMQHLATGRTRGKLLIAVDG